MKLRNRIRLIVELLKGGVILPSIAMVIMITLIKEDDSGKLLIKLNVYHPISIVILAVAMAFGILCEEKNVIRDYTDEYIHTKWEYPHHSIQELYQVIKRTK